MKKHQSMSCVAALAAALLLGLLSAPAQADLIINVGQINLLPDTANQPVSFTVTGGTAVAGLEFNIQVGDGGADLGGVDAGPVIQSIDLITGTIFDLPAATQVDTVAFPLAAQSSVDIFGSGTVSADGVIATVLFDTTGMFEGEFSLLLSGVAGQFDTTFFDGSGQSVSSDNVNGTVVVVPEPAAGVMLVGGLLAMLGLGSTRRRDAA